MGNNLLDFVMALVRDQDMAAQYAANPEQVIADAHLDGVQPADVSALIPVVSESIPAALGTQASQFAANPAAADLTHAVHTAIPADNIWASGAATSAFEAFDSPFTAPTHDPSLDAGLHAATSAVSDQAIRQDAITVSDQFSPSAGSAVAAIDQFQAPLHAPSGVDAAGFEPAHLGSELGAGGSGDAGLQDPFFDHGDLGHHPGTDHNPGIDQF
ncbi:MULTISPECIES: IniB N-terminal domain-containing protein [unclassified Mycobacterium]|uniref:Rv0340 family IniB-related protein n=1 Tax=unclassified Mycobacterium TaxID=2642494 RepID=UPI000991E616|nr:MULTISPECIES: IniB N-terminal domain-containing protein [unclassified Mycobacterium]